LSVHNISKIHNYVTTKCVAYVKSSN